MRARPLASRDDRPLSFGSVAIIKGEPDARRLFALIASQERALGGPLMSKRKHGVRSIFDVRIATPDDRCAGASDINQKVSPWLERAHPKIALRPLCKAAQARGEFSQNLT
jgi:hypothetical protein